MSCVVFRASMFWRAPAGRTRTGDRAWGSAALRPGEPHASRIAHRTRAKIGYPDACRGCQNGRGSELEWDWIKFLHKNCGIEPRISPGFLW
jgi:hypothetical protein